MADRGSLQGKHSVVIVGGGGYARETQELITQLAPGNLDLHILGIVANDPPRSTGGSAPAYPYLGTDADFIASGHRADVVIAIGDPRTRKRLANLYEAANYSVISLIHPHSLVGGSSHHARGVIISAFACVTADVHVGSYVHIDRAAQVGHGCVVGDFTTIHPAAVLGGNVIVGECVMIGTNSTILPGVRVGDNAIVGAGAVVTRSVASGTKVAGVPAEILSDDEP